VIENQPNNRLYERAYVFISPKKLEQMKKLIMMLFSLAVFHTSQAQSFQQKYYRDGMYFFDDLDKIKRNLYSTQSRIWLRGR
jgi:hypothetical protein